MTKNKNSERDALDRLADALVDDILNTSDEAILAEFRESYGDPEQHTARWRERFEMSVMTANKHRLAAAKLGVEASLARSREVMPPIDITEARRRLRAVSDNPDALQELTLAARKESEMSDAEISSILDDLRELGAIPADNVDEEKL